MSLMSKEDALKAKAHQSGATEVDVLRAALLESQERYNEQASKIALLLEKYDSRLKSLEKAVTASNKQETIDIQSALQNATDNILEPCQAKISDLLSDIDTAKKNFLAFKQKKTDSEFWENCKAEIFLVVTFAIGSALAVKFWLWWYDVPEIVDTLKAINQGIQDIVIFGK